MRKSTSDDNFTFYERPELDEQVLSVLDGSIVVGFGAKTKADIKGNPAMQKLIL